jgi:hypothetical protein
MRRRVAGGSCSSWWAQAGDVPAWLGVVGLSAAVLSFATGVGGLLLALSSSLPRSQKRTIIFLCLPGILTPIWLLIAIMSLASHLSTAGFVA